MHNQRSSAPPDLTAAFPVYAVPLREVMQLSRMVSHEELNPREWEPSKGPLCFVSHQWTSRTAPDPDGVQFAALKDSFSKLHELFTQAHHAAQVGSPPIAPSEYDQLWVWLDYWSIPQAAESGEQRDAAIDSIPYYATSASFMLVLCPPTPHIDTGTVCDLASWERRGWCRLERMAFTLASFSTVSPPKVYIVKGSSSFGRLNNSYFSKPAQSLFKGEFSLEGDRHRLLPVAKTIFKSACLNRKEQDVVAWRKLLAIEHVLFSGCTEWEAASELARRAVTVDSFLEKYELSSVLEHGSAGMTALHYAAYENNPEAVKVLIAGGAKVDARDVEDFPRGGGGTPLFFALRSGCYEASLALLQAGADVNHAATVGPPITNMLSVGHEGLHDNSDEMLALVLRYGADVNATPSWKKPEGSSLPFADLFNGPTMLYCAAHRGQVNKVRMLLQHRADPRVKCSDGAHKGRTPLDAAIERQHGEIVELLESYSKLKVPVFCGSSTIAACTLM